jgi:hypothetical protein
MAKPTDQNSSGVEPSNPEVQKIRKVQMLNPGFREEVEVSVVRPRILGVKIPSNPHDRRNLKLSLFAFLVALVIFVILESKQIYEAAREGKHQLRAGAHDVKHTILDFFKKAE